MAEVKEKKSERRFSWMYKKVEEESSSTTNSANTPTIPSVGLGVSPATVIVPSVDDQMVATLNEKIMQKARPGFDYLKYMNAVAAMSQYVPSEENAFKATFAASALPAGATKEKILESNDYYVKVLDEESNIFNSQFEAKSADVEKKNLQVKAIDDKMLENQKKIQELTADISKLQEQRGLITTQIIEEKAKIQNIKDRFAVSLDAIKKVFLTNREKISKYL